MEERRVKREQIRDFTARISEANQTGLLVILYEICMTHIKDAEEAASYDDMKKSIRSARNSLQLLRDTLNMDYSVSGKLLSLYRYLDQELALAVIKKDVTALPALCKSLQNICDAYKDIAQNDDRSPLMQNTEKVYAGLTYGRTSQYETTVAAGANRGFLA